MSVWFAIPTILPEKCSATFARWRAIGYRTAALVDGGSPEPTCADLLIRIPDYKGYAHSVNLLCSRILAEFPDTEWIVTGGDDVFPDSNSLPSAIASECSAHFDGTFGVMQPAGDKYGAIENKTACVSPWLGKEWCQRINGGRGPLWEEYPHYYVDGELMLVSQKLDRLWWRDDLIQYHDHHLRTKTPAPHLDKFKSGMGDAKALYESRIAAGFPGHEPT